MIVTCQICGEQVHLADVPEDLGMPGLRRCLLDFAKVCVHEQCAKDAEFKRKQARAEIILSKRMETLETIIPPLYQDTNPEDPRLQKPWHKEALAWVYGPKGLVLYGGTGTGKSRVAFLLLKREHLIGRACAAYSHVEFVSEATRASRDFRSGEMWIGMVKSLDLLVLDDLGKMRLTTATGDASAASGILFDLLDNRIKNKMPTIITTNNVGEKFESEWGDHGKALVRRFREFCQNIQFKA